MFKMIAMVDTHSEYQIGGGYCICRIYSRVKACNFVNKLGLQSFVPYTMVFLTLSFLFNIHVYCISAKLISTKLLLIVSVFQKTR